VIASKREILLASRDPPREKKTPVARRERGEGGTEPSELPRAEAGWSEGERKGEEGDHGRRWLVLGTQGRRRTAKGKDKEIKRERERERGREGEKASGMLQIEPLPATYATKSTRTRLEPRESCSRRIVTGPYVPTKKGSLPAGTKTRN